MPEIVNIDKLRQAFDNAGNILVVLGASYSLDEAAAALAFLLVSQKVGKKVSVFSPKAATVEEASLFGAAKITDKLDSGKLVISIPEALSQVDKVTHYLDGETLNIVVHPLNTQSKLSAEKVVVAQAENVFDLMFLLNTTFEQFFNLLSPSEQKVFDNILAIVVGRPANSLTREIQVTPVDNMCLSETMVWILDKLGLQLDADAASNLFQGITVATGFRPPLATSSTFEAAAICLRENPQLPATQQQSFDKLPTETAKINFATRIAPDVKSTQDFASKQPAKQEEKPRKPSLPQNDFSEIESSKVQQDWLVPKIFKSGSQKLDKT